jgi:hypothetical protein
MNKPAQLMLAATAAVLLLCASTAEAATCDATQLTPCAGAIIGNAAPTAACCSGMRAQRPCLCTYRPRPKAEALRQLAQRQEGHGRLQGARAVVLNAVWLAGGQ